MEHLGNDVATKFPQIHTATGRDATSFLHVAAKIKVPSWFSCKVSDVIVKDVEKFIQTVRTLGN